jgi:AcrR family transcriptional regulator
MATNAASKVRHAGRPREFDMDEVLDGALGVFRQRGYHAASLDELGAAMKLTPGSIYKAFNGKKALFLAAFDRYVENRQAELRRRVDTERDGRGKLHAALLFYAESSHGVEGLRGCLVVGAAAELATLEPEVADRAKAALRRIETTIHDLVCQGQADGSIPFAVDTAPCAFLLFCAVQGFRVAGKTGRSQADAVAAVEQAMRLVA